MIAALVPAKALDQAKGRLAEVLEPGQRRRLALAMLEDVLRALKAVPRIGMVTVVSPDADVLEQAQAMGAEAIAEPAGARGINQALSHALLVAPGARPEALLVVLADVPAITAGDVESILDSLPADRGAVLCPSHDRGTSALAMRPPGVIPFRFGPNSFPAHKREAAARGVPTTVLRIDSLSRDIDSPDDLRHLLSTPGDSATHRLLEQLPLRERVQR